MKLLIIEDERELSESIRQYLSGEDYKCEQAFDFASAGEKIAMYDYDCILLDLMLPGGSGLGILRSLKNEHPETGVIIVSAKGSLDDKIEGLKIGADDYIAKPFHLPELGMRIFALMRRRNFSNENILHFGKLEIDLQNKKASAGSDSLELTKTEYDLLLFLIENRKRVVSKSAVAEHLSGDMAEMMDDYNFVYAHIKNLKSKLSAAGMPDCIKTFYGTGYRWMEDEKSDK